MIDMRGAFDKTRFNWWIALRTPPSCTDENAVRRPKALSSKNAVASIRHLGSHSTNRILKRFWQRTFRWKKKWKKKQTCPGGSWLVWRRTSCRMPGDVQMVDGYMECRRHVLCLKRQTLYKNIPSIKIRESWRLLIKKYKSMKFRFEIFLRFL